jgi:hypothetical protein
MPQKGLTFISDRDARNPGGMHPNAHLWDNGNDPVNELKNVMKVRSKRYRNLDRTTYARAHQWQC